MKRKDTTSRRRFFGAAGSALSVPLVLAAAPAGAASPGSDAALRSRLQLLEDVDAIRKLNRKWIGHVNAGAVEDAARLFTDSAAAAPEGLRDIRGISADGLDEHDVIAVSPDGATATASIRCTVTLETPMPDCPLVDMARAQGGGVVRQTEEGVLDTVYDKRGGVWKIAHATYRAE